jgi:hypothetical protein
MHPIRIRYPIEIRRPLSDLLRHCETRCTTLCCGLGAIDLSPVQVASWVLVRCDSDTIADLLTQLRGLRQEAGRGLVLHCAEFNAEWTQEEFLHFLALVRRRLVDADRLIRFAGRLEDQGPANS